jgi:PKHD-type hydroxylase
MKNVWEVWQSALSIDECREFVAHAQTFPEHQATVGFQATARSDLKHRESVIRWLDVHAEKRWVDQIMRYVASSNRTNFGVDIVAPFDLQFTEYHGTARGQYDWHQDVWLESDRCYDRKLSIVVQLSDPADYEGGAFEFFGMQSPGQQFSAMGSLLIFPSFLQHRVTPVTKGLRRSLVSWIEGPRWR